MGGGSLVVMSRPPADVVRTFFTSMQGRDWAAAAECLAADVRIWWPATDERFRGAAFLAMQRAYPDGWEIEVVEVLAAGDRVSARVAVVLDGDRYWCFGSYQVREGAIADGVELWGTQGADTPPAWRARFTDGG